MTNVIIMLTWYSVMEPLLNLTCCSLIHALWTFRSVLFALSIPWWIASSKLFVEVALILGNLCYGHAPSFLLRIVAKVGLAHRAEPVESVEKRTENDDDDVGHDSHLASARIKMLATHPMTPPMMSVAIRLVDAESMITSWRSRNPVRIRLGCRGRPIVYEARLEPPRLNLLFS